MPTETPPQVNLQEAAHHVAEAHRRHQKFMEHNVEPLIIAYQHHAKEALQKGGYAIDYWSDIDTVYSATPKGKGCLSFSKTPSKEYDYGARMNLQFRYYPQPQHFSDRPSIGSYTAGVFVSISSTRLELLSTFGKTFRVVIAPNDPNRRARVENFFHHIFTNHFWMDEAQHVHR